MKMPKIFLLAVVLWIAVDLANLGMRAIGIKEMFNSYFIDLVPYHVTFVIYLSDSIGYFVNGLVFGLLVKKNALQIGVLYVAIEVTIYSVIFAFVPEARSDLPSPVLQTFLEAISASFIVTGCFAIQRVLLRLKRDSDVGEMR